VHALRIPARLRALAGRVGVEDFMQALAFLVRQFGGDVPQFGGVPQQVVIGDLTGFVLYVQPVPSA